MVTIGVSPQRKVGEVVQKLLSKNGDSSVKVIKNTLSQKLSENSSTNSKITFSALADIAFQCALT